MQQANVVRHDLMKLSNPPTKDELDKFQDVSPARLPPPFKRNILDRIFVNRDLRLDRIKWVGFDMDYTLAVYTTEYEVMSYDLLVNQLVKMGYPPQLSEWKYDAAFPVRGILLDKQLGNFLKIDAFGHIVLCLHGRKSMNKQQTVEIYPSLFIASEQIGKRFFPLSTLFNLPEICLFADLIHYFEQKDAPLRVSQEMSFRFSFTNIFSDVRTAMDVVHLEGKLKQTTLENISKYIKKTNVAELLRKLKASGKHIFLLTNSEFYYTEKVMHFLLGGEGSDLSWRDYFDVCITTANKPSFFAGGTTLREVNLSTGNLKIGTTEEFERKNVYVGGSIELFEKYTGAKGDQILYIGDHIYADIIKSKKAHAWRNLLVIPELEHELKIWRKNTKIYNHLRNLEFLKAEAFRGLDADSTTPPDISVLRHRIKQTVETLNTAYNPFFGSLFRSALKPSQFSMQVQRYADLYTYSPLNLLNYPLFYHFSAQYTVLPHENLGVFQEEEETEDP